MKRFFVAHNFVETLRPMYYLTKALGLVSFTANFKTASIRRTFKDVLIFVGYVCLNSFLVIKSSTAPFDRNRSLYNSALIEFILNLFLSIQMLAMIVVPIVNYLNAYRYDRLIQLVVDADRELERIGYRHDYSTEYFCHAMYLLVAFLLQIGCLSGTVLSNPFQVDYRTGENTVVLITFIMANLMFITSTCYCCEALWAIVYRYHKINVAFGLYFHTKPTATKKLLPLAEKETTKAFAVLYTKLSAIILHYNWCFFVHIFYVLASAFGLNLVSFFAIIHVYLSPRAGRLANAGPIILSQLFLSFFYLLIIFQIIFAGSLLHKKAKETAILLHKAIIYNECNHAVLQQLRAFSIQLSHQTPKVSCYFYDIDWAFLLTMISSFATYLNILVQFDIMQIRAERSESNHTILGFGQ
ncbi:uncharacterized protein LOC131211463 [Anopheles bellator]|uniref:uncharacterized protein LOC131211463 n=1 Tax=Anopheles bellator TaxID=139047 RepID=UPI0026498A71|nr:uncharacterized protein LOC131211463 [Anopheles bellator]